MFLSAAPRLWMIASEIPGRDYAPEAIEPRLRDLGWVSRIAVAHEEVVERLTRVKGGTVVPMKLFTMFSSPERARDAMRARRRELEKIVKHIAGCEEWGVRIMRGAEVLPAPGRTGAARSGTAFLAAKKQARDGARAQTERMAAAASSVLPSLVGVARDAKQRPVPEGAASPLLLDAAFLVPAAGKARFTAAVRKAATACREAGAELTLSGPWPAYNFIDAGEPRA